MILLQFIISIIMCIVGIFAILDHQYLYGFLMIITGTGLITWCEKHGM